MFATVITASVFSMMVSTMEISFNLQSTVNKGFCNFTDISGSSANHLDSNIAERIDRSAADTAANERIDLFKRQKRC